MNKAQLLEQLRVLVENAHIESYADGVESAIDLVEQLTSITDPTFPDVIKDPIPMRDYGVLYLVLDGSDGMWYVTRQDKVIDRSMSDKMIERLWALAVIEYYPETRETE